MWGFIYLSSSITVRGPSWLREIKIIFCTDSNSNSLKILFYDLCKTD
jgi:hypothetical protein